MLFNALYFPVTCIMLYSYEIGDTYRESINLLCCHFRGPIPRMASVVEVPSRVVRLDLSLNELTFLEHAGLKPFKHLRELNASLNKISKCVLFKNNLGILIYNEFMSWFLFKSIS